MTNEDPLTALMNKIRAEVERARDAVSRASDPFNYAPHVSDSDLYSSAASSNLVVVVPSAQRERTAEVALACLRYAESKLPDLEAAIETARAVGATGDRSWLSQDAPEVEAANNSLCVAESEVVWGTMFALSIVSSMADHRYFSNLED